MKQLCKNVRMNSRHATYHVHTYIEVYETTKDVCMYVLTVYTVHTMYMHTVHMYNMVYETTKNACTYVHTNSVHSTYCEFSLICHCFIRQTF